MKVYRITIDNTDILLIPVDSDKHFVSLNRKVLKKQEKRLYRIEAKAALHRTS